MLFLLFIISTFLLRELFHTLTYLGSCNFFFTGKEEVESGKHHRNSELGNKTVSSGLDSNAAQCCGRCGCLHKTEAASIPAWSSRSSIALEFSPETEELWTADGFKGERASFL